MEKNVFGPKGVVMASKG